MPATQNNDRPRRTGVHDVLSDTDVFEDRAERISLPRVGFADSFQLHAPLELLARQALLQYVDPRCRSTVRDRMTAITEQFERSDAPAPAPTLPSTARGDQLPRLAHSIAMGDGERAYQWMIEVAPGLSVDELTASMADEVLLRLAGAAHGSILLHLLLRTAPRSPAATQLGRGLVAELATNPDPHIEWIGQRTTAAADVRSSGDTLANALQAPASPGDPGSDFIAPIMSLVDHSGLATELLSEPTAGLSVREARRALLRTAAHSMLQDDPSRAPFGWTHCLTMPQATLGIARFCSRPDHAVAVASTYVLGFRATLSSAPIDPNWSPSRPRMGTTEEPTALLERGPSHAAATVWHAPIEQRPALVRQLASVAATHHDAHLAKYTLACFDAARNDPEDTRLYLAAAAYLASWWHNKDSAAAARADRRLGPRPPRHPTVPVDRRVARRAVPSSAATAL